MKMNQMQILELRIQMSSRYLNAFCGAKILVRLTAIRPMGCVWENVFMIHTYYSYQDLQQMFNQDIETIKRKLSKNEYQEKIHRW